MSSKSTYELVLRRPEEYCKEIRENMDRLLERGIIPHEPRIIEQILCLSPSSAYRLLRSAESLMGPLTRMKHILRPLWASGPGSPMP